MPSMRDVAVSVACRGIGPFVAISCEYFTTAVGRVDRRRGGYDGDMWVKRATV